MGIPLKFLNPSNMGIMIKIAKIADSLEKHISKRCSYCGYELGNNVAVVVFVEHLKDKHPGKILPDDLAKYEKLIKKMTK